MVETPVLKELSFQAKGFLKRHSTTILTSMAASGVVITSVMTAKATTKASKLLEEAEQIKGEELTKSETIKIAGPSYIPAILFGTATISCIFGSHITTKRKQAGLVAAYGYLDQSFKEYKSKVRELYDEDADAQIREEIAKDEYKKTDIQVSSDKQLFYDAYSKRYFESTTTKVQRAEYALNRNLVIRDYAYLNDFYDELGLSHVRQGFEIGWSMGQCMDYYWQAWIDFNHEWTILEDGTKCCIIHMMTEPFMGFEDYC